MTAPARPDFRRGAEAAAEAGKGGGNFPKTHYFGIDDGDSAILRFITDKDDWLVVDQHANVPTKPAPTDYPDDAKWPDKMGAVCRKDKALKPYYPDGCYICEFVVDGKAVKKAGGRTWALACLREEVVGDGTPEMGGDEFKGKVVGIRDAVREVAIIGDDGKPTGENKVEKAIVVVNMGYKNFFAALTGFAGHYKTILDRDYYIKRSGNDTSTTYAIIPMDPITMGDGTAYDLRRPEVAEKYATDLDLVDLLLDRSSDDFYNRFFDKRVTVSHKSGDAKPSGQAPDVAKPESVEPSADKMAALASRVTGYAQPSGGEAAPAAPAQEPAATAAPAQQPVAATSGMRAFE